MTNDEVQHFFQTAAKLELATNDPHVYTRVSWTTAKWIILRFTGAIYFVAFLGAYNQNPGLFGSQGLQPASQYFNNHLQPQYDNTWVGFLQHPSIFWFFDMTDENLNLLYTSGMAISALVASGVDSGLFMLCLWLFYFSIVTTAGGTSFYQYGWESQLLETSFLCIFLCEFFPQFSGNRPKTPPSPIVLWLFRWLCFRISIGAGLIKLRGDSCWTDKTCLHYHFETQPIPSPMSFLFHFLPKSILSRAVDLDLFVQVYSSWMVLVPTSVPFSEGISGVLLWIVRIGGFIQAGFMVNILVSGNFAFLNHLTIIPTLACLDDYCWPTWVQAWSRRRMARPHFRWGGARLLVDVCLFGLIASLSIPVIENLFQIGGKRQQMNASFGSFRLVNTYGAFGSVGKGRYEAIISISSDGETWEELEFPCKPGRLDRRPCFSAPYHYRVDWNIWFLGFKPHQRMLKSRETWMFSLLTKLLEQKNLSSARPWLNLFDYSSSELLQRKFENANNAPKYAKVEMYHYKMSAPLWELALRYLMGHETIWWNRTFEEVLIPEVGMDSQRQQLYLVDILERSK